MRFAKMHGLGNDYVYVNAFEEQVSDPPALAVAVSDRHFGIGSDGLVLIAPSTVADFRMEMYNADGSRAEMCGNASRCVGKYVYEHGMTRRMQITLETDAGIKSLRLTLEGDKVSRVQVDMGEPVTECDRVPCLLGSGVVTQCSIRVLDRTFAITPVSMGNPHGVIFLSEPVETFDVRRYGPVLEQHPAFPEKVNIEFVNVLSPGRLRMRVWERGSGVTLACGTGACATLVAASLCGLAQRRATVVLDGGELDIEWNEASGHVYMTGPAAHVFDGEYDAKG
ncbi:MAG TPA: diaminopimelate epimerase [Candidatus Ventricola gallistercoris]|nr:diaminopimelate epimerase [Candidatus Ventricola gallistercoris]